MSYSLLFTLRLSQNTTQYGSDVPPLSEDIKLLAPCTQIYITPDSVKNHEIITM